MVVAPENRRRAGSHDAQPSRSKSAPGSAANCCSARIIGCTATIGFWLIGVPYFYVLGLVAARRRIDSGRRPDSGGGAGRPAGVDGVAADGRGDARVLLGSAVRREQLSGAAHHGAPGRRQSGHDHGRAADRLVAARLRRAPSSPCRRPPSFRSCCRSTTDPRARRIASARHYTEAMRSDPLAFLTTELDTLTQQGLHRSLRVLDGRQEATTAVRRPHGRQPVVEQLPRPDDASEADRARDRGDPRIRRRFRIGADDRRHDGDPHGARAPARGVQEDRSRRRVSERIRGQRGHGVGDPEQRRRRSSRTS